MTVSRENDRVVVTDASTVGIDCISVGRNQWIFYIAIASTDARESKTLMNLLRKKLSEFVRID